MQKLLQRFLAARQLGGVDVAVIAVGRARGMCRRLAPPFTIVGQQVAAAVAVPVGQIGQVGRRSGFSIILAFSACCACASSY